MALFSFRHSVKTFSPKCVDPKRIAISGQTAAHLRYITRPSAASTLLRRRMPAPTDHESGYEAETAAQKRRGRVCERFIIALPVEATDVQRVALVEAYAEHLTEGQAGYVAAIHDKCGNDRKNPHAHLVAFDKHQQTGGRGRPRSIIGMARKNAVEAKAKAWATIHNRTMASWGYGPDVMIDHRSFAERGIECIPTIHEGAAARAMAISGKTPRTKPEWRPVDAGQSRSSTNHLIREINATREIIDASTNRLGKSHEGIPGKFQSGSEAFGTDRQRSGRAAHSEPPPFIRDESNEALCGTGPIAGRANSFSRREPTNRSSASICKASPTSHGIWPRYGSIPSRRRVRRVFVELIMLRNTLRARLAALSDRVHFNTSSGIAKQDTKALLDAQVELPEKTAMFRNCRDR